VAVHLFASVLLAACVVSDTPAEPLQVGYLCQSAYCLDECLRTPLEPYYPQAGDIVLFTDDTIMWKVGFHLAGTGHPYHSGIIVALPEGGFGSLEAGFNDTNWVKVTELTHRLPNHERRLWVRRRKVPLTPEQSAALTAFALRQDGKRYALIRLGAQLTPFRSRGPLRTYFMGKPHGERISYICSECVLEACVAAGLLDPETTRPAATYPRDMFFDKSTNLYLNKYFTLAPWWEPPARWQAEP
jgi:hypothetical protein